MMKSKLAYCRLAVACGLALFTACKGDVYAPKPCGYYRIALESKSYQLFDTTYPYRFEYPVYGKVQAAAKKGEPYWIDLSFPTYNATIYISYKQINGNLAEVLEDSYKMTTRHTIKANAMTGTPFVRADAKVYGMLTEIDGDVASAIQFYVTDSTRHFLRGSLYFNTTTNSDSLAPLVSYFKADIQRLMETFEWKAK